MLLLLKTWLTKATGNDVALVPVIPTGGVLAGTGQVNAVPAGVFDGVALNAVPLQINAFCVANTGMALFTVSISKNGVPAQLSALGVIV